PPAPHTAHRRRPGHPPAAGGSLEPERQLEPFVQQGKDRRDGDQEDAGEWVGPDLPGVDPGPRLAPPCPPRGRPPPTHPRRPRVGSVRALAFGRAHVSTFSPRIPVGRNIRTITRTMN